MKKDVLKVISGTAVLCVVMDIIFLLIGKFDLAVLWGTLLGFACASLNFCFLAFSVYKAVDKGKAAGGYIGGSYFLRLLFISIVVVYSIKSPHFNYVATVIPLVFPRVIIMVLEGIMKKKKKSSGEVDNIGRT